MGWVSQQSAQKRKKKRRHSILQSLRRARAEHRVQQPVARGLEPALAKQVAVQLMAHDALGAHARDELGISEALSARPIQAALASAGSFAVGAAMPLLVTAIAPESVLIPLANPPRSVRNTNEVPETRSSEQLRDRSPPD